MSLAGKNKVATALAGNNKSFTVLDAMEATVGSGANYQGTIFDEYACTNSKDTFAKSIRNQISDGNRIVMKSVSGGVTFTQANNSVPDKNMVTCTGMIGTNNYTFIAVGKSDMGSGDAFRAIHPVFKNDKEPPKVDLNSSIISVKWEQDPDTKEYTGRITSGTVTLVFTEGLWARPSVNKKPIMVDNCAANATGHAAASTQYQCVSALVVGGANAVVVADSDHDTGVATSPILAIKLNISDAGNGDGIVFSNIICDEAANGMDRGPLTVKIKVTGNPKTGYEATLEVPDARWKK